MSSPKRRQRNVLPTVAFLVEEHSLSARLHACIGGESNTAKHVATAHGKSETCFRRALIRFLLLVFLVGWVSLGLLGIYIHAAPHGLYKQEFLAFFMNRRNWARTNSESVYRDFDFSPQRYKRLSAYEKATLLLKLEQENTHRLENVLRQEAVPLPSGIAKSEEKIRNYASILYRVGQQYIPYGGNVSGAQNHIFTIQDLSVTLHNISTLMAKQNIPYFLFGPTLQRIIGGSPGLFAKDGLHLQYRRSLHFGVWFDRVSLTDIRNVLEVLGYTPCVEKPKGITSGLPGDIIFISRPNISRSSTVYISPFYHSNNFVWQGERGGGVKVSYEPFRLLKISSLLQDVKPVTTDLVIPYPIDVINGEQRGISLSFGGHSARFEAPTLYTPANLVVSCSQYSERGNDYIPDWNPSLRHGSRGSQLRIAKPVKGSGPVQGNLSVSSSLHTTLRTSRNANRQASLGLATFSGSDISDRVEQINGNFFLFHKFVEGEDLHDLLHKYSITDDDFVNWNGARKGILEYGEDYIVGIKLFKKKKNLKRKLLWVSPDLGSLALRFEHANTTLRKFIWANEIMTLSKHRQNVVLKYLQDSLETAAGPFSNKPRVNMLTRIRHKNTKNMKDDHNDLELSESRVYVAKVGDTLESISKNFTIPVRVFRELNGMDTADVNAHIEPGEAYIIKAPKMKSSHTSNRRSSHSVSRSADAHRSNLPSLATRSIPSVARARVLSHPTQTPFKRDDLEALFTKKWGSGGKLLEYMETKDGDEDLVDVFCNERCQYTSDGVCDDGGVNSKSRVCTLGSDCIDCGPRHVLDVEKSIVKAGKVKEVDMFPVSSTRKLRDGNIVESCSHTRFLFHRLKVGETIETLSSLYHLDTKILRHLNGLGSFAELIVGVEYLVHWEPSDTSPTDETSASFLHSLHPSVYNERTTTPNIRRLPPKRKHVEFPGIVNAMPRKNLRMGENVFVKSDGKVFKNFWWRGTIVAKIQTHFTQKYLVRPRDNNDPSARISEFDLSDLVLDTPASEEDLNSVFQHSDDNPIRGTSRILIFGRISDVIGGWESKIIGRANDGRFIAEVWTPKGIKQNTLSAKYYRIVERKYDDQISYSESVRTANTQALYLTDLALHSLRIPYWLTNRTYEDWANHCSIVPPNVKRGVSYDVHIGIHFFDWNVDIIDELANLGFHTDQINGADLSEHSDQLKTIANMHNSFGSQYVFVRPVHCGPGENNDFLSVLPESLSDCRNGLSKYYDYPVRLVVDLFSTTGTFGSGQQLVHGVFNSNGVLNRVHREPLFDLYWMDLGGWRFRVPFREVDGRNEYSEV
jgi:hypothetical protein